MLEPRTFLTGAKLRPKQIDKTLHRFYKFVFDLGGQDYELGTICLEQEGFDVISNQ